MRTFQTIGTPAHVTTSQTVGVKSQRETVEYLAASTPHCAAINPNLDGTERFFAWRIAFAQVEPNPQGIANPEAKSVTVLATVLSVPSKPIALSHFAVSSSPFFFNSSLAERTPSSLWPKYFQPPTSITTHAIFAPIRGASTNGVAIARLTFSTSPHTLLLNVSINPPSCGRMEEAEEVTLSTGFSSGFASVFLGGS